MKKIIIVLLCLMVFCAAGCKNYTPVPMPTHSVLNQSASIPDDADGITSAYIRATDAAINLVTDKKREAPPEFISFDFGTNFALRQSQRDVLVASFQPYGIPVDTLGLASHGTLSELAKGFVILYVTGSEHNSQENDMTITVEVCYQNKGFAYYFDFNLKNGEYIMVNYENAYENVHAS